MASHFRLLFFGEKRGDFRRHANGIDSNRNCAPDGRVVKIGDQEIKGKWDVKQVEAALKATGYPGMADKNKVNSPMTLVPAVTVPAITAAVFSVRPPVPADFLDGCHQLDMLLPPFKFTTV